MTDLKFEITPPVLRAGLAAFEEWKIDGDDDPVALVAAILFACQEPLLASLALTGSLQPVHRGAATL